MAPYIAYQPLTAVLPTYQAPQATQPPLLPNAINSALYQQYQQLVPVSLVDFQQLAAHLQPQPNATWPQSTPWALPVCVC